MGQKLTEMSDQEIRDIMRAIAKASGRPLSDERIEVDPPAYRSLSWRRKRSCTGRTMSGGTSKLAR
jgi:hypothetical protein